MRRLLTKLVLVSILGTCSFLASALPELCLQSPSRTTACPQLLYKKTKIAIPSLALNANDILCICLTDIKPLIKPNPSATEKIDHELTWQALAERYQLNKEEILALIRD